MIHQSKNINILNDHTSLIRHINVTDLYYLLEYPKIFYLTNMLHIKYTSHNPVKNGIKFLAHLLQQQYHFKNALVIAGDTIICPIKKIEFLVLAEQIFEHVVFGITTIFNIQTSYLLKKANIFIDSYCLLTHSGIAKDVADSIYLLGSEALQKKYFIEISAALIAYQLKLKNNIECHVFHSCTKKNIYRINVDTVIQKLELLDLALHTQMPEDDTLLYQKTPYSMILLQKA